MFACNDAEVEEEEEEEEELEEGAEIVTKIIDFSSCACGQSEKGCCKSVFVDADFIVSLLSNSFI